MKEQIENLHELFLSNIDRQLFFKLILNITNGGFTETPSAYANYLKIDSWMELYSNKYINTTVNKEQLIMFLNYMQKYVSQYVGKSGDFYFVTKDFSNEKRSEENFKFESIVFQVFEVIT